MDTASRIARLARAPRSASLSCALGIAEVRHHPVAEILRHAPSEALDGLRGVAAFAARVIMSPMASCSGRKPSAWDHSRNGVRGDILLCQREAAVAAVAIQNVIET